MILIAPIVLAALFFGLSAVIGWFVMLTAGNLYVAGVIPASLGFVDSFWLGVIFTTFSLLFTAPNAVK